MENLKNTGIAEIGTTEQNENIEILQILSLIVTVLCPPVGVFPLYQSYIASEKKRKNNTTYVLNVEKTYKYLKIGSIILLSCWVLLSGAMVLIYNFR